MDDPKSDRCAMNTNTVIRKGEDADIAAVEEIAVSAWEKIYAGYRSQLGDEIYEKYYKADWRKEKAASIRRTIESGAARLYVTESGGKTAAFITIITDREKKTGVISNNAVHPAHQGFGLGSAQYRHIFKLMKEEGIEYVSVTTGLDEAHAPARRAYEKAGFAKRLQNVTYYMKL